MATVAERQARMKRVMGFVYLGGIALWIVVGVEHALPRVVVWLAIAFCCTRMWMAFRPARDRSGDLPRT